MEEKERLKKHLEYLCSFDKLTGEPEALQAVAYISARALDGARAGKTIEEVTSDARCALTKDDVMEDVADLIPMVQVEAVFTDGSRLVTIHTPIQ